MSKGDIWGGNVGTHQLRTAGNKSYGQLGCEAVQLATCWSQCTVNVRRTSKMPLYNF